MAKDIVIRIKASNLTKREISKARRQLDGLGKQTGATSKRMGGLRGQVNRLSKNFASMNPLAIGAGAAVAALGAAVVSGVRSFVQFESTMTRLQTLVGLSAGEVENMTEAVRRLGPATGRAPQELAEALFEITSAGLRGQDALDTLEASAKAAAVGLGSTATVADIATSAVNAFGAESINAQEAVGVLLKAVREGKTNPEELAASMGKIIPIAATMGVEFSEVAGIVASLTKSGASAAEGVTGVRQAMLSILGPTSSAIKVLEGTSLTIDGLRATLREENGLLTAFRQLRQELTTEELDKFIGRAEGLTAVLQFAGEGFEDTSRIVESTADSFGALNEAFGIVGETSALRAEQAKAVWSNALDTIGEQTVIVLGDAITFWKDFGAAAVDAGESAAASIETLGQKFGEFALILDVASANDPREILSEVQKGEGALAGATSQELVAFREFVAEQERALEAQRRLTEEVVETGEAVDDVTGEVRENKEAVDDVTAAVVVTQEEIKKLAEDAGGIVEPLEIQRNQWTDLSQLAKDYDFTMLTVERRLLEMEKETAGVVDETVDLEKAQQDYNAALAAANDLAQLLGGNLGQLVGQTLAASSALENLSTLGGDSGILGGLGSAFKEGKGEAGGLLGILGGVGGALGAAGPLIGLGTTLVSGLTDLLGGPDVKGQMRDIGRDIGAEVSEGLAEQIAESGQNAQLFLREIFAEGNLGIDSLAREVGDLFSMFEQGGISESGLIRELRETLPILIQNFDELGPAGEEQINRITSAAERLGIDLGEIDELLQKGFATDTLEEMKEKFDLTGEEVRELAKDLGVDLQTSLERAAAQAGVTVEEFKKIQDEIGDRLGKEGPATIEEVTALLESMGLTAGEAAEQLGVGIGEGAAGAVEGTKQAGDNLTIAADEARRLKQELTEAARQAGRVNANVNGGGAPGSFRHGTPGFDFVDFGGSSNARLHGREAVVPEAGVGNFAAQVARALRGAGGGGNMEPLMEEFRRTQAKLDGLPREIQRAVRDGMLLAK